ncbi:MAG: DUF1127 domain-containing protein [Alphaproteobacteria bacterium]|nr:DUF1127 domain-containing protein [Alphaproteobacteria bacterium]
MRTIWIVPGMFGLNVGLTFGHSKSGKFSSLKSKGPVQRAVHFVWTALSTAYGKWRQRQDLASLPDYMLKDLGLNRQDVTRECAKPIWR